MAGQNLVIFGFDQRGFGRTVKQESQRGVTSRAQAFKDIDHFLSQLRTQHPSLPLFLYGHSMGGGLVTSYACRKESKLEGVKGIISSAPLFRQTPAVRLSLLWPQMGLTNSRRRVVQAAASPLLVRAGSILGAIAPRLKMTAPVNPPVSPYPPRPRIELLADKSCHYRTSAETKPS